MVFQRNLGMTHTNLASIDIKLEDSILLKKSVICSHCVFKDVYMGPRAHKKCVTPIETHSLGKIIKLLLKIEHLVRA